MKKTFNLLILLLCAAGSLIGNSGHADYLSPKPTANPGNNPVTQYTYYLSLAAIFQDEAPYLKEWIEYYTMLGVEHFYLYNNLSQDHYAEVLQPYVESGLVDLIEWPYGHTNHAGWAKVQKDAYRDALKLSAGSAKWLIILDADEFIVPNKHGNIPDLLKYLESKDKKEKYAQYEIRWVIFGTSDIDLIPSNKLMIETLTKNGGLHDFAKCVVRPEYAENVYNPHKMILSYGKKSKDVKASIAVVNHYMFRDKNYLYNVKIPRREAIGYSSDTILKWEARCCEVNEFSGNIFRFVEALRGRMDFPGEPQ